MAWSVADQAFSLAEPGDAGLDRLDRGLVAVPRCLLGLVLPAAVEALVDDLAHCIFEIRNGNIILMSRARWITRSNATEIARLM
jgi:hypothetical protein